MMRHPAHAEAGNVANLDRITRGDAFRLTMGLQPLQHLRTVAMFAAVHRVIREPGIIDGTRFPVNGSYESHAIDPGPRDAGMRNERCPERDTRATSISRACSQEVA